MLFAAQEYIIVYITMFAHFQHDGHEPEVVLFHHLWHLAGPCRNLFYSFRICTSTGCDNWSLIL